MEVKLSGQREERAGSTSQLRRHRVSPGSGSHAPHLKIYCTMSPVDRSYQCYTNEVSVYCGFCTLRDKHISFLLPLCC